MVRVRFAPSPTGDLHIGGVRTALFNYLYAKKEKGIFILRIEDTDEARSTEASTGIIINAMKWLKLNWDEGPGNELPQYAPYYQMKRKEQGIYQKYIDILLEKGYAYKCYCTPEEVEKMREQARLAKQPPKYNGHCANLTKEQQEEYEKQGRTAVIRFRMPKEGKIEFDDIVRGHVSFENALLDDFVLMKANGVPTYNFACVIDDHLMEMTHVIRGDDHISNTPRQIHIFKALGWEHPTFAHLSMILGSDGARLSKRHGHTSVLEYRKEGYLQDALINYLALLGWSPEDNEEFFTLDELIKKFDYHRINKSPSVFDVNKLRWMNSEYIKKMSDDAFLEMAMPYVDKVITKNLDKKKIALMTKSRIEVFPDICEHIDFFEKLPEYDVSMYEHKKMKTTLESSLETLKDVIPLLEKFDDYTNDSLYAYLSKYVEEKGVKIGYVMWPIRTALSGKQMTPAGATEILEVLGKEESVSRLKTGVSLLEKALGR